MSFRLWDVQFAGSPKIVWCETKATAAQLELAAQLDIEVSPDDTFGTVAAQILDRVGAAVGCPPRDVSEKQLELAEELEVDITDCTQAVAFIRIKEAIERSNLDSVKMSRLEPGDVVVNSGRNWFMSGGPPGGPDVKRVVSSVRQDGQVFFKDGGQAPARYLTKLRPSTGGLSVGADKAG